MATQGNGRNAFMESNIKQRIAAGALALSLLGGTGVGVVPRGTEIKLAEQQAWSRP